MRLEDYRLKLELSITNYHKTVSKKMRQLDPLCSTHMNLTEKIS